MFRFSISILDSSLFLTLLTLLVSGPSNLVAAVPIPTLAQTCSAGKHAPTARLTSTSDANQSQLPHLFARVTPLDYSQDYATTYPNKLKQLTCEAPTLKACGDGSASWLWGRHSAAVHRGAVGSNVVLDENNHAESESEGADKDSVRLMIRVSSMIPSG